MESARVRPLKGPLLLVGDRIDEVRRGFGVPPPPLRAFLRERLERAEKEVLRTLTLEPQQAETFKGDSTPGILGRGRVCRYGATPKPATSGSYLTDRCDLTQANAPSLLELPVTSSPNFKAEGVVDGLTLANEGEIARRGGGGTGVRQIIPRNPDAIRWDRVSRTPPV